MSGGSSTPATLIRDEDGNFVGLVLDGAVYRIQTETKITGTVPVSGPLTDTQLRATAVPVSAASLPLPTGAATETTAAAIKAKTDNLDVALSTRAAEHTTAASPHSARLSDGAAFYKATTPADTQPVSVASLPLPSGAATQTTLASIDTKTLAAGQAAMVASSPVVIASDQSAVASKNAAASQVDGHSASIGATSDADTALTMIGRLKKIVALLAGGLPAALISGRLDINNGAWLGSTAPTIGQKTMANSIPIVFPSDQVLAVTTTPSAAAPSLAFGDVALAAITTAALYRTAYTEQAANFTGSIASANANDTAAGTGARTVRIFYVDATGATAGTEDVTLNGVTFVNLVTSTKCFIEKIEVLTVGSSGSNTGTLTLKTGAAGAGATVCTIGATDNRTFLAHHYVVTGKTANVTGILVGSNVTNSAGSCIGFLRAKVIGAAAAVEKQISDGITVAGLDSSVFRSYGSQIQVAGPARITLYVTTATGSAFNYRGSFDSYDA